MPFLKMYPAAPDTMPSSNTITKVLLSNVMMISAMVRVRGSGLLALVSFDPSLQLVLFDQRPAGHLDHHQQCRDKQQRHGGPAKINPGPIMADIQVIHAFGQIDQGKSSPQGNDDGHHDQQVIKPGVLVPQTPVSVPGGQHLKPPGPAQGDGQ